MLNDWLQLLQDINPSTPEVEVRQLSTHLLRALAAAVENGSVHSRTGAEWDELRKLLAEFSCSRAC